MENILLDGKSIIRSLNRIAHEIIEKNKGARNVVLLGIRTRGITIAKYLQKMIEEYENVEVPCGELDPRPYRDDGKKIDRALDETHLDFPIDGRDVILVDDVLFTGRTQRASIEHVFSLGRPNSIQIAVLVDRGHRELPFKANYVGKNIPTSLTETVKVRLKSDDGISEVVIIKD